MAKQFFSEGTVARDCGTTKNHAMETWRDMQIHLSEYLIYISNSLFTVFLPIYFNISKKKLNIR